MPPAFYPAVGAASSGAADEWIAMESTPPGKPSRSPYRAITRRKGELFVLFGEELRAHDATGNFHHNILG
jgi:hypothetical protein